jgi:hypothetical protein
VRGPWASRARLPAAPEENSGRRLSGFSGVLADLNPPVMYAHGAIVVGEKPEPATPAAAAGGGGRARAERRGRGAARRAIVGRWLRRTNVWRRVTSPARGAKRLRSVNGWLMALSTPTNPVT